MLTPQYDPKLVEDKIYETWMKSGYFNPDNLPASKDSRKSAKGGSASGGKNYIVYMPLPNVTGALHMGHALDNTAPDILIRYHRMKGFKTLWLPGTDHAGIATQYTVEKDLRKQNISRWELGREKFVKKVWEWKQKYGEAILNQLKKLGVSADWSRVRFTMDEAYSRDVLSAFVHYYKKDWLYRGLRTVNWCPRDGTSLSELELEYEDGETKLWYIRYPLKSDTNLRMHANNTNKFEYVTVATTRPETMLGDTAIAVNPTDKRYKHLIGKRVILPIQNREIPIVGDIVIDPKFGTGAVKVTPAHDILDFEIGQRHQLETVQVIDERARMTNAAGKYAGLKTIEAREKIVNDLKEMGLLVREEPYKTRVAQCYRCGATIEPIPSVQWFLKMNKLGMLAKKAVTSGQVKILPKNFKKTYLDWLGNIRDWSVSRQIWWGHRLPVWQCKCQTDSNFKFEILNFKLNQEPKNNFIVSINKPDKKCRRCNSEYEQVPDVLDTWFSSALWPFAGLSDKDRKRYYPGNFVTNARDILNLWDTRMIFSGLEFMGKVPFETILIHGTILTKEGKRMSKSLGTGIDPLEYVERYGADATRFAVIWQASGQDIHWDEAAAMAGRKFANKIWNASRFVIEQIENSKFQMTNDKQIPNYKFQTEADKAILKSLLKIKKQTGKNIESFEFSKALHDLYDFFWHEFCDKYIEEAKKQLTTDNLKPATKNVLAHVLFESLKMLHPFMPFITEAIYEHLPVANKNLLMVEKW